MWSAVQWCSISTRLRIFSISWHVAPVYFNRRFLRITFIGSFNLKCTDRLQILFLYNPNNIPYTTSNTLQKFQTEDYYGANTQGKVSNCRWLLIITTNVSAFAHTLCYVFRKTLKQKTSIFLNSINQKFCIKKKQNSL